MSLVETKSKSVNSSLPNLNVNKIANILGITVSWYTVSHNTRYEIKNVSAEISFVTAWIHNRKTVIMLYLIQLCLDLIMLACGSEWFTQEQCFSTGLPYVERDQCEKRRELTLSKKNSTFSFKFLHFNCSNYPLLYKLVIHVITNDVSDYINLLVRTAHIICNHPVC